MRTPAERIVANEGYAPFPGPLRDAELAITLFWQEPTTHHGRGFVTAMLPLLRSARQSRHPGSRLDAMPDITQLGPWIPQEPLGRGADGYVYRVSHEHTDLPAALKIRARGDALLTDAIGEPWPDTLLRIYDSGLIEAPMFVDNDPSAVVDVSYWPWCVRELADESLADWLAREGTPSHTEALHIFSAACTALADVHKRGAAGWSAHPGNVFRVGEGWKIGDFGRLKYFVPDHHPFIRERLVKYAGHGSLETLTAMFDRHDWGAWSAYGPLPYNRDRLDRLRADDCAGLAALLIDLLGGKRWDVLFRALNRQPFCSSTYTLTEHKQTDAALSRILNRCFRGEAGGAPLFANDGRGDQTVYTDPLELLSDVQIALGRHTSGQLAA